MSDKLQERFLNLQKAIEQLPEDRREKAIEKIEDIAQGIAIGNLTVAPAKNCHRGTSHRPFPTKTGRNEGRTYQSKTS